jgi:hypothetical protein
MSATLRHVLMVSASLVVSLVLGVGCSGSEPSATPAEVTAGTTTPTEGPNAIDLTDLSLTVESAGARRKMIGQKGGTLTVRTSDGAVLKLTVPPSALTDDVTIRATPGRVTGTGISGWGVDFGPPGLEFFEVARLAVTPPAGTPAGERVAVSVDRGEVTPAFSFPEKDPTVIAVPHFSSYADVRLSPGYQLQQKVFASDRASKDIATRTAAFLATHNGGFGPELGDQLSRAFDEYAKSVVAPLFETTSYSCENIQRAIQAAGGLERQLNLLSMDPPKDLKTLQDGVRTMLAGGDECEKRTIELCRSRRDPKVLLRYWLGLERTRNLMGFNAGSDSLVLGDAIERAKKLCRGSYSAKGTAPGGTITGVVRDLGKPFTLTATLTGGSGAFRFLPADDSSGSWEFTGGGGGAVQTGSGRYTTTGEDPGPLKLTTTGQMCVDVSRICAPANHEITLTPG